jgi:hypothetical protein
MEVKCLSRKNYRPSQEAPPLPEIGLKDRVFAVLATPAGEVARTPKAVQVNEYKSERGGVKFDFIASGDSGAILRLTVLHRTGQRPKTSGNFASTPEASPISLSKATSQILLGILERSMDRMRVD